ncbi:hypothetical protein C8J57DRAFT_1245938 [Mycena rebaudengoi]|nr:hypothetical protein C8J57DRAFT_1245938 [Mycena rebaudengoi]
MSSFPDAVDVVESAIVGRADWKRHKPMCKALTSLEKNSAAAATLVSLLPKKPSSDLQEIRKLTDEQVDIYFTYLQRQTAVEHSWIHHEPRCLVWSAISVSFAGFVILNLLASVRARKWPSADWRDGLSHCQMNTFVRLQAKVDTKHSLLDRRGQLLWVPVRVKSRWVSLKGKTWEGEFDEEICKSYGMPRTIPPSSTFLISSASDTLSMPMTILYGLSKLNEDNAWTRKQTLTVHVRIFPSRMDIRKSEGPQVLGANIREVSCRLIFEEILHRLPEVNKLEVRIVLIDGNINQFANSSSCVVPRYRVAIHSIMKYAQLVLTTVMLLETTDRICSTYHDFVRKQGDQFETPDLCIAFNSGATQGHVGYTWQKSIKFLVERKLPSLFTAYDREEAEGDAAMLRAAGAAVHPLLGPCLNPWGSQKAFPTAHSVYGFHVDNGWLAGGFK